MHLVLCACADSEASSFFPVIRSSNPEATARRRAAAQVLLIDVSGPRPCCRASRSHGLPTGAMRRRSVGLDSRAGCRCTFYRLQRDRRVGSLASLSRQRRRHHVDEHTGDLKHGYACEEGDLSVAADRGPCEEAWAALGHVHAQQQAEHRRRQCKPRRARRLLGEASVSEAPHEG